MENSKARVGLARRGDRRSNVFGALDLVRTEVGAKVADHVMIKPNFLSSDNQLASTHADAARGVLDFFMGLPQPPSRFTIAEGANEKYSGESFDNFSYRKLADEYGVSIDFIDLHQETEWVETTIFLADREEVPVRMPKVVLDCPCTVSLAVAKTHDVCVATLALKNMIMGTLHKDDRIKMHGYGSHAERVLPREAQTLSINLARVGRYLCPDIGVIDATQGLQGNGPGGTDAVEQGVAVASADTYAADAVMAKAMGFEPLELGWLHYAQTLGYGVSDLEQIEVLESEIAAVQIPFTPHESTEEQLQWQDEEAGVYLPAGSGA
jgi:uncharacterized protein (DUF362 family)